MSNINVGQIGADMLARAEQIAAADWAAIRAAATVELRGLAQRLSLIIEAFQAGELSQKRARAHFKTARFHVKATIAMLTVMVEATIEKIVNAALAIVREAVNTAAGFVLV